MLIVDPPRKGLDDGVLRLLLGKHETAEAPGACREVLCIVYVRVECSDSLSYPSASH